MSTITEHEARQILRANDAQRTPVMFVHGLWLLPNSWDRWAALFEKAGYTALTPGWPDDPESVDRGQRPPRGLRSQDRSSRSPITTATWPPSSTPACRDRPLLRRTYVQILAGRGCAAVSVAIDPAPFRGVLPLPISALKSAWPCSTTPPTATAPCR